MTKPISLEEFLHDGYSILPPTPIFSKSFVDLLYQMDLDWNDLLDTDPKHYEVTDEQINLLFD